MLLIPYNNLPFIPILILLTKPACIIPFQESIEIVTSPELQKNWLNIGQGHLSNIFKITDAQGNHIHESLIFLLKGSIKSKLVSLW